MRISYLKSYIILEYNFKERGIIHNFKFFKRIFLYKMIVSFLKMDHKYATVFWPYLLTYTLVDYLLFSSM